METTRRGADLVPIFCGLAVGCLIPPIVCLPMVFRHCPRSVWSVTLKLFAHVAYPLTEAAGGDFKGCLSLLTLLCLCYAPYAGMVAQEYAGAAGISEVAFDFLLDVVRLSACLWSLPVFFAIVRPPGREMIVLTESVPAAPVLRLDLPYDLGSIDVSGCMAELLQRESLTRTVAAIGVFSSLVGATAAAAVMVAGLGVLQMETVKAILALAALVTVLWCLPRLFFSSLNSHRSTAVLLLVVVPAAIATVSAAGYLHNSMPFLVDYADALHSLTFCCFYMFTTTWTLLWRRRKAD